MSIFSDDGSMFLPKAKSDYMEKLENRLPSKTTMIQPADCVVYDGHAIIQMLPFPTLAEGASYKDMASNFMS